MARLELRSVTKRFGTLAALDDVTLVLESGEFFSMLGPSGCGKTTALRIVAGFEMPDAGQVLLDGDDITGVPPNKRDMGMVFQAYSLFPNLTARENVEFGLRVRGRGQTDRATRANELLNWWGWDARGPLLAPALRWPAATRGARSRSRHPTEGAVDGRAAFGARRAGPGAAPGGDPTDPDGARDHRRSTSRTIRKRRCRSRTGSR